MTQAAEQILGTWTLTRWARSRDGGPMLPLSGARGRLIYLANGIMSAHLERVREGSGAVQAISYSGQWVLTGNGVAHRVDFASIPEWPGTTLTRTVLRLDADTLHLETPPEAARQGMLHDVLEWARV